MERMRRTSCLFAGIILLAVCRLWAGTVAADADALFSRGCDLYENGDFDEAAEHFEVLLTRGIRDADVYYNLGNAYYKQGQLGKAVANYRRALVLAPRDGDARANLDLLRSIIGFRDTTASYNVGAVFIFPLRLASPRELQVVSYIGYYLAVAAFLVVLFSRGRLRRNTLRILAVVVLVTLACFSVAGYGIDRAGGESEGVVIVDQAEMMSGPGTAFEELIRLPDGVEVRLEARSGIWIEVELRTGEIGWIREQDIEMI